MIRPGDESALSPPIGFDSLQERILPLERSDDLSNEVIEAVRVSLGTTIDFISSLQKREEAKSLSSTIILPLIARSLHLLSHDLSLMPSHSVLKSMRMEPFGWQKRRNDLDLFKRT